MHDDSTPIPPRKAGRPRKLSAEHIEILREVVRSHPSATLGELAEKLRRATGVLVEAATLRQRLTEIGVVRQVAKQARAAAKAEPTEHTTAARPSATIEVAPGSSATRYGYTPAHRTTGEAGDYPSSLTDAEWELVHDVFASTGPGAPTKYPRRAMVNAICYVVRGGIAWRMLPKSFPPWHAVFAAFQRWSKQGRFEVMYDRLRALWRNREGREVAPTGAAIDSQSVKTSPQGGVKGFDAGKKVKGRKRHLLVDTLGLLVAVLIQPANVQDRDGAMPVIDAAMRKFPSITKIFADSGYAGRCAREVQGKYPGLDLEVVRHPANRSVGVRSEVQPELPNLLISRKFMPIPHRWVVERNHAWNDRPRRMAKDHDRTLMSATAWVWFTEACMLARRLTWPASAQA
jgi:transposase